MDMQRRTMTMISKLYYEENMTQQQIAKQTGLSRMKVSRILQKNWNRTSKENIS